MTSTAVKRANRRAVERRGKDVTHVTFSETGTDSYGTPEYSESTSTVTARIEFPRTPRLLRSPQGDETDSDATFYVKDTVSVTGTGTNRQDEFRAGGDGYIVVDVEDQDNGILACHCLKK